MFLYVCLIAGHKAKSKIRGKYTSVSSSAVGDVTDRQDLVLDDEEGDDIRSSDEESSDFFDTDSDSSGTLFLKYICFYSNETKDRITNTTYDKNLSIPFIDY